MKRALVAVAGFLALPIAAGLVGVLAIGIGAVLTRAFGLHPGDTLAVGAAAIFAIAAAVFLIACLVGTASVALDWYDERRRG